MARPRSRYPTELELEILKVLWRQGPLNGRQVRDALAAGQGHRVRDLAHTSVLTILNIMVRKGYLRRIKQGRSHVYRPTPTEEHISNSMLSDLVTRVFDGSAHNVVSNLIKSHDIDEAELERIRRTIESQMRKSR